MYSSSATHQSTRSGFYIYQTDDLSLSNDFIREIYNNDTNDAPEYTSVQVYGSDMSDVGNNAICFASKLDMNLLIPKATLIG